MPIRLRKLLGSAILVLGLTIYVLCAMRLGVAIIPEHWAAQLAYSIVAGVAWVFPVRRLLFWMEGARREAPQNTAAPRSTQ